ncbi:MAG: Bax inhibitor-1/YccA family protein [Alphaproteobacteria bacterium]|nr:Bax inhibitor-1/YccA family protein [Alphaproteobacteria bacterium]
MNNNTKTQTVTRVDEGLRQHMLKVYNYMTGGLIATAIAAYAALYTPLAHVFFNETGLTIIGTIFLFAPLIMAFAFNSVLSRAKIETVQLFFWGFAIAMGFSLAPVLNVYTETSIVRVFLIAAATFGSMSLYGYTTQKDLTGMGSFLFMGLIGIIIASLINIFLGNQGLSFVISLLAVGIFVGLTAYDTQKIRESYNVNDSQDIASRKAISGALSIYLDFINLFIHLLRIFGERK